MAVLNQVLAVVDAGMVQAIVRPGLRRHNKVSPKETPSMQRAQPSKPNESHGSQLPAKGPMVFLAQKRSNPFSYVRWPSYAHQEPTRIFKGKIHDD
jgi:hypothetical protein